MNAAKPRKGLTPKTINDLVSAAQPGMFAHGKGLCLVIAKSGQASFALRYTTANARRRLMTLEGIDRAIDAAKLRSLEWQCADYHKKIKAGVDPLAQRNATATATNNRTAMAFEAMALEYVEQRKGGWKGDKHRAQWLASLRTHAFKFIGHIEPHLITTEDVLAVMRQRHVSKHSSGTLWSNCRETASRVRSKIEAVIGAARALGISDPATRAQWDRHTNPATWDGNLEFWLTGKRRAKQHFNAIDWRDLPSLFSELRERRGFAAKALTMTILTAARTSEIIGAPHTEFDLDNACWTIPAARMKAGNEHRVPLSSVAVEVMRTMHRMKENPFVFASLTKRNMPLHNMAMLQVLRDIRPGITTHGMRSAFRDWAADSTMHPDSVVEMALAHVVKSKTERAYRRGDLYERRVDLMQMWSDYLTMACGEYKTKWVRFIA